MSENDNNASIEDRVIGESVEKFGETEKKAENNLDASLPEENVIITETGIENSENSENSEEKESLVSNEEIESENDGDDTAIDHRRYLMMSKGQLVGALKEIIESEKMSAHKEVNAIKQAFHSHRKKELDEELLQFIEEGNAPEDYSSQIDPLENELKELLAVFKEKRASYLEEENKKKKDNLELKLKILDQLRDIVEDIDNINHHFSRFQQLQQDFKSIKDIPDGQEKNIWPMYQHVTEQFYDRWKMNKELRDLDFKKNLEIKNGLIEEARKLSEAEDVLNAFRRLQELHSTWRETGPVAKDYRESIWEEFSALSTLIRKRHQEYFENRKNEEQANKEAKEALCVEIENIEFSNLDKHSAWEELTKKVIEMQSKWKELGFAPRKINNELFARFRKRCDEFFDAKAAYFQNARDEYEKNIARKTELCELAEALKENENLSKAVAEANRLQEEWKNSGYVPRKQSESLWQRFSEACRAVYDARKKETSGKRQEENENYKTKLSIIDEINKLLEVDSENIAEKLKELQDKWRSIGFVPFKHKETIQEKYRETIDAVYKKYDLRGRKNRNRTGVLSDEKGGKDKLQRQYEQKKNELKTYENNLGFFNIKSSAGNSMLKEMEKRIQQLKEEIATLEEKMKSAVSSSNE